MVVEVALVPDAPMPLRTGGVASAAELLTVTPMALEVVLLPAASRATAVRLWLPLPVRVVFQTRRNGDTVSSGPRSSPSRRNWTPATPTSSEAEAETVTATPDTVAPFAGACTETVGGVVSGSPPVWGSSARNTSLRAAPFMFEVNRTYLPSDENFGKERYA